LSKNDCSGTPGVPAPATQVWSIVFSARAVVWPAGRVPTAM